MVQNTPKWYETQQNMSLGSNGVYRVHSLRKIPTRPRGINFWTFRPVLHRLSEGNQMVPNATKWYRTHQNMSLGSNGVVRVCSLRNDSMPLRGMNFCTSSERFAPSFIRQLNSPKCTQMVRNASKHEFRVQWGGSGVFVAKWFDATSWHKLLH